jgi:hypothetical protein
VSVQAILSIIFNLYFLSSSPELRLQDRASLHGEAAFTLHSGIRFGDFVLLGLSANRLVTVLNLNYFFQIFVLVSTSFFSNVYFFPCNFVSEKSISQLLFVSPCPEATADLVSIFCSPCPHVPPCQYFPHPILEALGNEFIGEVTEHGMRTHRNHTDLTRVGEGLTLEFFLGE